jgi:predicted dehydrogenase
VRWTEGRNLEAFVNLLHNGRLQVADLVTHQFEIQNASSAYELITGRTKEPYLGVLLTYPQTKEKPAVRIPVQTGSMPAGKVNVGVIGAGNYAKATFLPAMRKDKDTHFVGIASINGVNAQHAAAKFGFAYATSSAQEIIRDKTINSVVIMTRHDEHAALSLQALRAKKHVYCEKPLALTLEDLKNIEEELAKPKTPLLMVGFNRRFAPLSIPLQEFFSSRSEPLYAHYTVNAGFLPSNHWLHDLQQGGGRIIGEGCHFIDYLTFLANQPISAVQATALPNLGKYHQDNMHITLEYADGSIGQHCLSCQR